MAKASKAKLKTMLEEWGELKLKESALIVQRDGELLPIVDRYEKKCQPIRSRYAEELLPLQERRGELEALIGESLLSDLDDDGAVRVTEVASEIAKAQVHTTSKREIAPSSFFDLTPAPARDKSFWDCVVIGVQKAEKFLGSRIAEIATKKLSHKVEIKLK